jgi:NAD(P)-dependent dehydrogenase (short-subunit alcohol dehydrogenase family)
VARSRYELSGKAALVTGAARGIGAETARQLARKGARVSLVGLEPELLERVAAECGPDAVWFEADVTDAVALERAVEGTVDRFGGIDVAMANAGIAIGGASRYTEFASMERLLAINLIGAMRTLTLCLPHVIERRGYLLPVASVAAIAHSPALSAYSASKAGIEAFANALRLEVRHLGVDVGVAYYSWIDTELVRGADGHRDFDYMRSQLKGPLAKTYPVSKAAAATIRGIERRARWVTCPGWVKAMIVARGLSPLVAEGQVLKIMPEMDRLSREEAERLGERATAPVGAGGEAAARSASLR